MIYSGRNLEISLELLLRIIPFIVAADERLTITWASGPVLRLAGGALGLKFSDVVQSVEPREEITPLSIARNAGVQYEVLLKNGARSVPLIGEWVLSRGGFIFLAGTDVRKRGGLNNFFLDGFEDNFAAKLFTAREENCCVSLKDAKLAADALQGKNEFIRESNQRLELVNAKLEKEITEHRRAVRKLEESHDIINKSPVVVFLWRNAEGWPVEHVSENVEDLFGYTAEEFMSGKVPYAEIIHPDDLERLAEEVFAYSEEDGRKEFSQEYRIITKDGKVEWLDDRTLIRRNKKGEITHYQGIVLGITERKRAEEDLRESENKYRTLLKTTLEGYWLLNLEGETVEVNGSLCRMLGYSQDEVIGKKPFDFVDDENREIFIEQISKISTTAHRSYEITLKKKNGEDIYTYFNATTIRDESGEILGSFAFITDITERKQSEEALRRNEERLELALQGGDLGTWDLNIRGDEVRFNERWAGMKGYSLEGVEPDLSFWSNLIHPEDLLGVREKIHAHFEGKTPFYEAEFRMRHKSGEWLWVLDKGKVIERDGDGNPLRACGTHLDITERKRAEQALREGEAKYRGIIENMQDVFYRVDLQGRLTLVSPSSVDFFGYESVEDIIGRKITELYARPGDRDDFLEVLKQSGGRIVNYEVLLRHKDGGSIPVIVSSAYCRDESGDIIGVEGVLSDISERKRAEEDLIRAKEAAEAANRVKGEFLATMSHEIRTPLNGVMGMLQLALDTKLTQEQKDYLETSLTSSHNLLGVINDILDISQIEAGKMQIVWEEFNLPEILRTVTETFGPQAAAKGIKVEYEIDAEVPRLFLGDGGRIRQILFNLIGNSLKFTEQGKVRVEVSPLWQEDGAGEFRLFFSVSDTGIGIPEDKFEYIFEPFTQVDGSYKRKFQGTGLGLGIVKRLVTVMGGTVSVDSEEGVGTVVYFSVKAKVLESSFERRRKGPGRRRIDITGSGTVVPFARGAEHREFYFDRRGEVPGRRQDDIPSARFKILVAEDNPVNRIFAVKILEKLGHGVTAVDDGKQALSALAKDRFDLVFLDVQMPVMDGIEATRAIRESTSGDIDPRIPLIAMTGDRERFLNAGMDDYIAKPVESRELAAVIRRVVDSKIRPNVTRSA